MIVLTSVVTVFRISNNSGSLVKVATYDEGVENIERCNNFSYINFTDGRFFEYSNDVYVLRAEC